MAELEMPTLHVGRYVDLLKRRRWQLVPAALLGLAAGMVVAWLIPRFYEAETQFRIRALQVAGVGDPRLDPMLQEIKKARSVIASYDLVEKAIKEERGYDFPTEIDLQRYIHAARSRIVVTDIDPGQPGRSSAILGIKFRDQDRKFAADMANRLRDLYVEMEFRDIQDREESQLSATRNQLKTVSTELDQASNQLAVLQRRTGIDPQARNPLNNQPFASVVRQELETLRQAIAELEGWIKGLNSEIATLESQKPAEPEMEVREPPSAARLLALQDCELRLKAAEGRLAVLTAGNKERPAQERIVASLRAEVAAHLAAIDEETPAKKVMVPEWVEAKRKIDALKAQLASKAAILESKQGHAAERAELLKRLPEIEREFEQLGRTIKLREDQWKLLNEQQMVREANLEALKMQRSELFQLMYAAPLPLEPTYPNKTLIAVLGAAIGLGVLIGLVFLLDVLQSTFKTFDEVARALPVPTLGGISFLELEADLRAARARRLRLAMTVTLVVGMVAAVMAIYFIEPVRLPGWVRDLLDKLLDRTPAPRQ